MKDRPPFRSSPIKNLNQPLVVLSGTLTPAAIIYSRFLSGPALDVDLFVAVLSPSVLAISHLFFMVRNAKYLQSDEDRAHERLLDVLRINGGVVRDANMLHVEVNPEPAAIEAAAKKAAIISNESSIDQVALGTTQKDSM